MLAKDPHGQRQTLFLPVRHEQAKQTTASREKTLYAPKALTVRVVAGRRHPASLCLWQKNYCCSKVVAWE
jgi:hypothetical protein